MSDEMVKMLAETKSYLESRLQELNREVEYIKTILRLIDEALSSRSFVSAAELRREAPQEEAPRPAVEPGRKIMEMRLSTRSGDQIALMQVYERGVIVKPLIKLHSTTPPFRAFLVNRILEGFRKKDRDLVAKGEISESEAFSYEVVEDEERELKEIRIYNYRDRDRLTELRGALRWTFNKMSERE